MNTTAHTNGSPIITDELLQDRYQIVETDSGLQISESRVLLFDVMELHNDGLSIYEIAQTFNLTPLQVQTAVNYIEAHHADLEPQFAKAVQARIAREAYYRQQNEAVWERIANAPLTPERAAFYALRDKNRRAAAERQSAEHSQ